MRKFRYVTVVRLSTFSSAAKKLVTEDQEEEIVDTVAQNPEAGDIIQGTGGFRKLRIAPEDGGKRGGLRLIYFFHNDEMPIFLFTLYPKTAKASLTKQEKNWLKKQAAELVSTYLKRAAGSSR